MPLTLATSAGYKKGNISLGCLTGISANIPQTGAPGFPNFP